MCEVASFKNFENSLTTVKVMTKTKVVPFYLGHGVVLHYVQTDKKFLLVQNTYAKLSSLYRLETSSALKFVSTAACYLNGVNFVDICRCALYLV